MQEATTLLFRPVGPRELELLRESGWRRWPPRLPEQPIFYPVTNERYAVEIASRWNVDASGAGYVTAFRVRSAFMERYDVQCVGASYHTEWWIPAEELEELNANIVGTIEVIQSFGPGAIPAHGAVPAGEAARALQVRFGGPSNGWLRLAVVVGESEVELTVSYTPNDFLRELLLALLGGSSDAVANCEPERYVCSFLHQADCVTFRITEQRTGNVVFTFSGTREEVVVPFWRALRRLETEFVPDQWRRPFPSRELAALTSAVNR